MQKNSSKIGALLLALAAVIWGFSFVAQVWGADSITPFLFNFSRYLIGALAVIPVFLLFEKNADDKGTLKTTLIAGMITGTALFLASYFQQYGLKLTDSAGKGGFITGLYMIIVPIFGIVLGRKTNPLTWAGALFGVAGLFLICMGGGEMTFTKGDIFLILGAVFFAVQILSIDHFGSRTYTLRFAFVEYVTCMLLNLVSALIFDDFSFAGAAEQIKSSALSILYCGLFSVGVAYTLQIVGQKRCEPTSASIIMSTESLFSAIGGAMLLNERMSPLGYLGCVLMFVGIILSQLKWEGRKKHNVV